MNESERWSIHLEYLKVAIALATGILTAAAAVYWDAAKVPGDASRWVLLASAFAVLVTLVYSVLALIALANRVALSGVTGATPPPTEPITRRSGVSFFALIATGLFLFVFFAWRTILGGTPGPQQAIEATQPIVERQYSKAGGPVTLASLETKGDRIHLVFKVGPAGTATAVYDSRTGKVVALAGPP
jgi:lysylphosphatidylglycerol synthetase-like protein (DUF2156 family)